MRSTTRIEPDGTVTSIQTLLVRKARLPEGAALADLLRAFVPAYTRWISLLTAGSVEIRESNDGRSRARVVPLGPVGLVLGPPRVEEGPGKASLLRAIEGGVLVGRAGGTLAVELAASPGGVLASVALHGFRPRVLDVPLVGSRLFLETQDVIHARHSKGFLAREVAPRLRAANARAPRPTAATRPAPARGSLAPDQQPV